MNLSSEQIRAAALLAPMLKSWLQASEELVGMAESFANELHSGHPDVQALNGLNGQWRALLDHVQALDTQPKSESAGQDALAIDLSEPVRWLDEESGEVSAFAEPGWTPLVAEKALLEAKDTAAWYQRRCQLLQASQARMQEPERTLVCDVLANGALLHGGQGELARQRYGHLVADFEKQTA